MALQRNYNEDIYRGVSGFELPDWSPWGTDKSMPDGHSRAVPPLPIPNRTVKRLCADDSAETGVKVGYRQANIQRKKPSFKAGLFFYSQVPRQHIIPFLSADSQSPVRL